MCFCFTDKILKKSQFDTTYQKFVVTRQVAEMYRYGAQTVFCKNNHFDQPFLIITKLRTHSKLSTITYLLYPADQLTGKVSLTHPKICKFDVHLDL